MTQDYRDRVRTLVLDGPNFRRASLTGSQHGASVPWTRVTLRPVLIHGERHVQFAYYDDKRFITKNYKNAGLAEKLEALLQLPFRSLHVASTQGELQVSVNKSGSAAVHFRASRVGAVGSESPSESAIAHNRQKNLILPDGKPDPYLEAIGLMTKVGTVKADRQRKFKQINEFLRLLEQTGELESFRERGIQMVDYGCGNAYLTFAAYHYLNHILGIPTWATGVDLRADLLEKHARTVQSLGWDRLTFQRGSIGEHDPDSPPDITLSLHACDTATDDALARGILHRSQLIIAVPCCHHHLQQQIQSGPEAFRPVMRHGILAERLADVLTDALRALILRIMGYQTDVLQFTSAEHTARNVMIRAVRTGAAPPREFLAEYLRMKEQWQITPYLEQLLGGSLQIHFQD